MLQKNNYKYDLNIMHKIKYKCWARVQQELTMKNKIKWEISEKFRTWNSAILSDKF